MFTWHHCDLTAPPCGSAAYSINQSRPPVGNSALCDDEVQSFLLFFLLCFYSSPFRNHTLTNTNSHFQQTCFPRHPVKPPVQLISFKFILTGTSGLFVISLVTSVVGGDFLYEVVVSRALFLSYSAEGRERGILSFYVEWICSLTECFAFSGDADDAVTRHFFAAIMSKLQRGFEVSFGQEKVAFLLSLSSFLGFSVSICLEDSRGRFFLCIH